jgi:HlyD family secretion protein
VQVGAQVSGRIEKLYADFNSQVKKGQLLAEIDPQLFRANVLQAQANIAQARAQLESAVAHEDQTKRDFARQSALLDQKLIGQADFDAAKAANAMASADVTRAKAAIMQANAQLQQSALNLTYTKIISPIDGVVISRTIDVGQTVAAAFQAPTLFTIAKDLREMQVDTNVAEADIGKLKPGLSASFTVDAYPGERFAGRIRQIRDAPQTVQNVVTYDVVIDVDNPDLKLLPGMTANAEFIIEKRDDVLQVANSAFRFRPPADLDGAAKKQPTGEVSGVPVVEKRATDRKSLWVLKEGKPSKVPVKAGISDGHNTEIVEGALAEGDAIITSSTGGEGGSKAPAAMRRPF